MQFKTIFAAVATLAAVASALPTASEHNGNGQCAVGQAQCCSQIQKQGKQAQDALAGLGLAFNEVLDGAIGFDCQQIPIGVLGVAVGVQNTCKNTTVCCQGSANNGLIQTSCTPLSIN
ncbi:hydrophobin 2 [Sporisorium reilianum f. sp. reilianum]|uniref:Hydrophobin n=1 Tax=Sporisorium reilianum f. sp. reilianum TaxID=72559 RepID=A0A2N8UJE1_9BASI|nr:hydrophobin 2 [Sporisorium reilianum f. sp. reilianum]